MQPWDKWIYHLWEVWRINNKMTKGELKTIILKVRNECALEEPTKITYYWDEEGKIVFKIFFDSLYIPQNLRVENDKKIKNLFSMQNVYEFKDDFKIIDFNTEEGFVKVLPKDQNFQIINNYRDLEDSEKNESVLKLAGKKLKESLAIAKGFPLFESDSEAEQLKANTDDAKIAAAEEEGKKETNKDKPSIKGKVVLCYLPIAKALGKSETMSNIDEFAENLKKAGAKTKVFFDFCWGNDFAKWQNFGYVDAQMKAIKAWSDPKDGLKGAFDCIHSGIARETIAGLEDKEGAAIIGPNTSNYSFSLTKAMPLFKGLGINNIKNGNDLGIDFSKMDKAIEDDIKTIEDLENGAAKKIYTKFIDFVKKGKESGVQNWDEYFEKNVPDWKEASEQFKKVSNNTDIKDGMSPAAAFVCCCYARSDQLMKEDEAAKNADNKSTENAVKNMDTIYSDKASKELQKAYDQILGMTVASKGSTADATKGDSGFGQTADGVGGGAGTEFKDGNVEHDKESPAKKGEKPGKAAEGTFLPAKIKIFCFTKDVSGDFGTIAEAFKGK